MFMCVVNLKSVNKLDLTWKQSFLISGVDPISCCVEQGANASKLLSTFQNILADGNAAK